MLNKLRNRKKKGFTLIELIVVLVIMVILAAAAIPTIMGYVENARKASYLSNMRAVYVAAQSAITEGIAEGVDDFTSSTTTGSTTTGPMVDLINRISTLTNIPAEQITVVLDSSEEVVPTEKDAYVVYLDSTDKKTVTKIAVCYNDNEKIVELIPGEGSNAMGNS